MLILDVTIERVSERERKTEESLRKRDRESERTRERENERGGGTDNSSGAPSCPVRLTLTYTACQREWDWKII